MQRFFLQLINFSLLFLILVGVPAATHAQIGSWLISSAPTAQLIILWGLGLAAGLNFFCAWKLIKDKSNRKLGWEWATVFGGLWLACYGYGRGWFNFDWLKQALLWLQKHF
jgi:hypothetical protein